MAEPKNRKSAGLMDPDSPFMATFGRLTMILVSGLLWTITSLPIITVGASSSALYYVMMKTLRAEEENYVKDYFMAFRRDFKQATVVWLMLLVLAVIFGFSAFYYFYLNQTVSQWLGLFFVALAVILLTVLIYVFPIISRFSNSLKNILMMAFVLPFQNLKWTVALLLMAAAVVLVCICFSPIVFFGYGLFAFGSSLIFIKVLKPLETAIEEHNNSDESAH